MCVGDTHIPGVPSARNIGAVLDDQLNMEDHVKSICKASYMHLHNVAKIGWYLTKYAAATLIHSFMTSKLDNLNVLLYMAKQIM